MKQKNPIRFELNRLRTERLQAHDEMRVIKSQKDVNPVSYATKMKALRERLILITQSVNEHKQKYGLIK